MGLLRGFDKAKEQVKALYPSLLLFELDPLKKVVDGKLVLVPSPEDEDAEMRDAHNAV